MEREPLHDEVLETLAQARAGGRITEAEFRAYREAYLHTIGGVAIINSAEPPADVGTSSECGVDEKALPN